MNLLLDTPAGMDGRFNVGDDIQTVAAAQFMQSVDRLVGKETIAEYSGPPGKLILNGWFMHKPENWPPPPRITPLLTSMHLSPPATEQMLSGRGRDYFREHGPVGCRDQSTLDILNDHGVEAYLSGCLTLTLDRSRYSSEGTSRHGIYDVDILYKLDDNVRRSSFARRILGKAIGAGRRVEKIRNSILQRLLGEKDRQRTVSLHHSIPIGGDSHDVRWGRAIELLKQYANAELVITSRIHCALPCLAFGTPVIFVDSALEAGPERARLESLLKLFHVVRLDVTTGVLDLPAYLADGGGLTLANHDGYLDYRNDLIRRCQEFFHG